MQILHITQQQRLDILHGFRRRQVTQHAPQPRVRFDPVRLGRLQHRVDDSAGVGAGHRVAEQPCLAADDERPDRVLGAVMPSPGLRQLSWPVKQVIVNPS